MTQILIIEDDPAQSLLLREFLKNENLLCHAVESGYDALERVKRDHPEVILMDLGLPDIDGFDLIKEIQQISKNSEIIIVTGQPDADSAMTALRLGAKDYLVKPVTKDRLLVTVHNALERVELVRQVRALKETTDQDNNFYDFVGASNSMRDAFKLIDMASQSDESLLVSGEQGTGKGLCAETIHRIGARKNGPFIRLNCELLEQEHAQQEIENAFLNAEKGILYFKHISNLPLDMQSKILKLMEEDPDIRVIGSCISSPLEEVEKGKLREDLFYRLNILSIDFPPLRQRSEDVGLLASFFLQKISQEFGKKFETFETGVLDIFKAYHWPGNVRELENIIKSIVTLNESTKYISLSMLPKTMHGMSVNEESSEQGQNVSEMPVKLFNGGGIIPIRDLEQMAIKHALEICDGNVQEAALHLKISPATLYRKKPQS